MRRELKLLLGSKPVPRTRLIPYLQPILYSIQYKRILTNGDTRIEALYWILKNSATIFSKVEVCLKGAFFA